ncbi:MAG: PLxRFG domain-containing protein [Agitococcus sp.]|nr:PLxRFG domain-containing protein [Agitococcus sp.]
MPTLIQAWGEERKRLQSGGANTEQIEQRRKQIMADVAGKLQSAGASHDEVAGALTQFDSVTSDQLTDEERGMASKSNLGQMVGGVKAGFSDIGNLVKAGAAGAASWAAQGISDFGENNNGLSGEIAQSMRNVRDDSIANLSPGMQAARKESVLDGNPQTLAGAIIENTGQIAPLMVAPYAAGVGLSAAGASPIVAGAAALGSSVVQGGLLGYGTGKETALDAMNQITDEQLLASVNKYQEMVDKGELKEDPPLLKAYKDSNGSIQKTVDALAELAGNDTSIITALTMPIAHGVGRIAGGAAARQAASRLGATGARNAVVANATSRLAGLGIGEQAGQVFSREGAKTFAKNIAPHMVEEGLQESGEQWQGQHAQSQVRGDLGEFNTQDWNQIGRAGLEGGLIGGIVGRGTAAIGENVSGRNLVLGIKTTAHAINQQVERINELDQHIGQAEALGTPEGQQSAEKLRSIRDGLDQLRENNMGQLRKSGLTDEEITVALNQTKGLAGAVGRAEEQQQDLLQRQADAQQESDAQKQREQATISAQRENLVNNLSSFADDDIALNDAVSKLNMAQEDEELLLADVFKARQQRQKEQGSQNQQSPIPVQQSRPVDLKMQKALDELFDKQGNRNPSVMSNEIANKHKIPLTELLPAITERIKQKQQKDDQAKNRVLALPDLTGTQIPNDMAVVSGENGASIVNQSTLPEPAKNNLIDILPKNRPDVLVDSSIIVRSNGKPFSTEQQALQAAKNQRLNNTHQVKPVDGGFALEQRQPEQQPAFPVADNQTPAIDNTQAITDVLAQHIETKSLPDFIGLGNKFGMKPLAIDAQYREMLRTKQAERKALPVAPVEPFVVQPAAKPKPTKNAIDPENDSLLVALAKHGGLSRDEAISHGIDPALLNHRPAFGKPLFPKTGGLSFDRAAEALSQDNYPVFEGNDYNETGLTGGNDRKATVNALASSLMDALNGNDVGTPQYHVAKAQRAYDEEQEQARIDALFEGKGNSKADWLDEVSDALVERLIENPSAATQNVIEVIQNDEGTETADATGNRKAETQPTADETSRATGSEKTTSQSESGGREGASSPRTDTGQQIAEALDATATAISAAAHQSAINRFKKEDGLTYRNPTAIEQVQKDDRYNVEINADGHAVVKGIKDGDAWVGQSPMAQTGRKEAQVTQEQIAEPVTGKEQPSKDIAGNAINDEWTAFADDSGSLNIPRDQMPQIKAEHRGAMVNFLNARDIAHEEQTVTPNNLKPTQAEFSPKKVAKAKQFTEGDRSILVSSDDHVLDGHHQWMAKRDKNEDVKIIRLNAPIRELLNVVKEFPSATTSDESLTPTTPQANNVLGANKVEPEAKQKPAKEKPLKKDSNSKTPTLDKHNALMDSVRNGKAITEDFKQSFADISINKDAILLELNALTKDQLLKEGGYAIQYRYKNDKKSEIADAVYLSMVSEYALGRSITYGMGKNSYENAIKNLVEGTDQQRLDDFAQEYKQMIDGRISDLKAKAEALENPQTLDDFRMLMRKIMADGKSRQEAFLTLSAEQRIKYDELEAESTKEARETRKRAAQAGINTASQTTDGKIIETKHTRDGYDLFVVQLSDRLSTDDYKKVLSEAKKLGGWYSSYKGGGAIVGFQFKDKEAAQAFLALAGGDTTAAKEQISKKQDDYADNRSQSAAERLLDMAEKMEAKANEELDRDRKANTARRARFAASAEYEARSQIALAKTMRNIAESIKNGTAKFLDNIRMKVDVEALRAYIKTAKDNEIRSKHDTYAEQEKRKGQPPTVETADFATYPTYTLFRSDLAFLGRQLLEIDGLKKLGQQIMAVADDVSDAYLEFAKKNIGKVSRFQTKDSALAAFSSKDSAERAIKRSGLTGKAIVLQIKRGEHLVILSPSEAINLKVWEGDADKRITLKREFGNDLVEAVGRRAGKNNKLLPYQFQYAYDKLKALSRIGIETPSEFRNALREFIALQEEATNNKVREMELSMVGRKKDGLDFFPTPEDVAQQMIDSAEITEDMAVLEPSAGMGHIADMIRAAGAEPDVIEMSGERRELLQEKGYHLAEVNNFMDMQPRKFFTYGDVFVAPDGIKGIMRGVSQSRVRLEDEQGNRLGLYNRDELTGVAHRGVWSGYDRIIMNPPFSNRQDAEHVRHAYDLLKPNGRIVAIMGEGVFFGSDKKAVEFREWLESVGGTSEKLPDNSFMDSSLPVNTGVNARMVIIDKQDSDSQFNNDKPASTDAMLRRKNDIEAILAIGKNPNPEKGLSVAQAQRVADAFMREYNGNIPLEIRVVAKQEEAYGQQYSQENIGYAINGSYQSTKRRVVLVASSFRNPFEARDTLRHETLGHFGLNTFSPSEKMAILQRIIASKSALSKQWQEIDKLYADQSELMRAEEVFAFAAESGPYSALGEAWNNILALLGKALRKAGIIKSELTSSELHKLAQSIAKGIRNGTRQQQTFPQSDSSQFSRAEQSQFERLLAQAGKMIAEQGKLLAPNGNQSKLNRTQWAQVRTANFRNWFGDWVNDPANASKVVDENGEPLVVYHGTGKDFNAFDKEQRGSSIGYEGSDKGFYFTKDPNDAELYAFMSDDLAQNIMPVFLNIRNPSKKDSTSEEGVSEAIKSGHDGMINLFGDAGQYGGHYVVFESNQIKSATGNQGAFSAKNDDILFSRRLPNSPPEQRQSASNDILDKVKREWVARTQTISQIGLWYATIGSKQGLAHKDPQYKKVFDLIQKLLNHVNVDAYDAIEQAPDLLGRLETWGDHAREFKRLNPFEFNRINKDREAAAVALFEGTLANGIFTDKELKDYYELTADQIAIYRDAHSVVNKSLDNLAKSEIIRLYMNTDAVNWSAVESLINEDVDIDKTHDELTELVTAREKNLKSEISEIKSLLDAMDKSGTQHKEAIKNIKKMEAEVDKFIEAKKAASNVLTAKDKLIAKGYIPLMRFGDYTLTIRDKNNEVIYFEMFETRRDANAAKYDLKKELKEGDTIETGTISHKEFEMFKGLTPETVALFAKETGLEGDPAYQKYLELAVSNKSPMKRLIHRKGIAGFNKDIQRTLASFVMSNARLSAKNIYNSRVMQAISEIDQSKGALKDDAIELHQFVSSPLESLAWFRNILFLWNLGLSVAFGAINLLQPLISTLPKMSTSLPVMQSARILAKAYWKLTESALYDGAPKGYEKEFARAKREGKVDPQNTWLLQGIERGTSGLTSNYYHNISKAMGLIAQVTESTNRRATLIAGLDAAKIIGEAKLKELGFDTPYDYAVDLIDQTQNISNKGNRSNWAQSPLGALLLVFRSFAVNQLELLARMARDKGDKYRKGFLLAIALMWAQAGVMGLPYAQNLTDLFETAYGVAGKPLNVEREIREFFGNTPAEIFMYGVSATPGFAVDLHGKLSMGNTFPATGLFNPNNDDRAKSREITEFFGASGGLLNKAIDSTLLFGQGDIAEGAKNLAPRFATSAMKAEQMAETGVYTNRLDALGSKVADVTMADVIIKALDFQPARVAREQRIRGMELKDIAIQKKKEGYFVKELKEAFTEKDKPRIAAIRLEIKRWNEENPTYRVGINIRRQVIQPLRKNQKEWIDRAGVPREMKSVLRQDRAGE